MVEPEVNVMELHERIKDNRIRCGLTQEELAEKMEVSRQAVTKWEQGKSAPSTENLFRLADIFGTTVDLLLPRQEPVPETETKRFDAEGTLLVIGIFLLTHVLGRVLYTVRPTFSLDQWLLRYDVGQFAYLYGWLQGNGLFWYCMVLCAAAALLGKRRLALTAATGFALGIVVGEWLGPNPAGAAVGNTHYGWAIWGGIFLASILLGLFLQRRAET